MELLKKIREGDVKSFEWFYFITLALLLAFGTIQNTGNALDNDKSVVSVISCSMYPEYNVGDILVVQGQDFEDIEVGDVVIYKVPDRIDFSVDGKSYTLEENSPTYNTSVQTSIGNVRLLEVDPNLQNGNDKALITVAGERYTVADRGGEVAGLEVQKISGQPFPIVHRVIQKDENSLETKGDANNRQLDFEQDVRPFQIYGTTALKIPRVGAVKLIIMDLVGFNGDKPLVIDNTQFCN